MFKLSWCSYFFSGILYYESGFHCHCHSNACYCVELYVHHSLHLPTCILTSAMVAMRAYNSICFHTINFKRG